MDGLAQTTNCTYTETQLSDEACFLSQLQHADTGQTSPAFNTRPQAGQPLE